MSTLWAVICLQIGQIRRNWKISRRIQPAKIESRRDRQRRNQDGGVEGHALTPSCKNTRITTGCWTIIDRKTLELTKKDTPHQKKKEKPQWDGRRGAIRVKSNPITGGWVTHKTGKHLHHRSPPTGVKVLSTTSGCPTWGSSNGKRNS